MEFEEETLGDSRTVSDNGHHGAEDARLTLKAHGRRIVEECLQWLISEYVGTMTQRSVDLRVSGKRDTWQGRQNSINYGGGIIYDIQLECESGIAIAR